MAATPEQFESSIVRIYDDGGKVKGAGFRISAKHLITCAHVVADALHLPRTTPDAPAAEIKIDFPLCAPGRELRARVTHWRPVLPSPAETANGESDIAVLEIQNEVPAESRAAPLVTVNDFWDHPCRAFGFPKEHDAGVWADGVLKGRQAYGWVQIDDPRGHGFFLAQGFSGTLVWDLSTDGVAGMVVAVEGRPSDRTAYMIPATILARVGPELIREVSDAPQKQALMWLEPPGATTDPSSRFYVSRPVNKVVEGIVMQEGTTTTIKGPGQMGKSTLLVSMVRKAKELGRGVALIDLQEFDKDALDKPDSFFYQFCMIVAEQLGLEEERVDDHWKGQLGNIQRVTRFFGRYVLKTVEAPVLLAVEEVDRILSAPLLHKDFFSMVQRWHQARGADAIWKKLSLALVMSTEPYRSLDDVNQTPLVGEVIELEDFTYEEADELNRRHNSPLSPPEIRRLVDLVAGHPFLVRSALYQVAAGHHSVASLFELSSMDEGPFAEHLGHHYFHVYDKKDLVGGLIQVINHNACDDERIRVRLVGTGLVRVVGNQIRPRSPLYAEYFKRRLNV